MAKKKAHGGKRKGAGRRVVNPEGRTAAVVATVPGELIARLDSFAKERDWSRSQAITEAIRGLLDAKR